MTDPARLLDRLLAKAGQLYSLPAVAIQVLRLTDHPQVDTRELKECIENDPALTSKILRVVNSSLFGLSREVSDLNQALALLGIKPLKLLVLGFSLPNGLFAGVEARVLGQYWRHTLTKAVAAREISRRLWDLPGDDAFIAGLLQDLGTLLLVQELGEPYAEFLDRVIAAGADLSGMERKVLGFTHAALSARLLDQWGLPQPLTAAIAWDPCGAVEACGEETLVPPAAESPLARILHLAELFAQLLADRQGAALGRLLETGQRYRAVSEAQVELLVADLEEKVRQLALVLSLQLPDGMQYTDVLAKAHRILTGVADQTAEELLHAKPGGITSEEELLLKELRRLTDLAASGWKLHDPTAHAPAPRVHAAATTRREPPPESPHSPGPPTGRAPAQRPMPAVAVSTPILEPPRHTTVIADPGLLERLTVAVAACRQLRTPLSLLLVELGQTDELIMTLGVAGFEEIRRVVEGFLRRLDYPGASCGQYGDAGFATVLPGCERRQTVRLGDELVHEVQRLVLIRGRSITRPVGLAVGVAAVALLPKNFPPQDLLVGAQRCLYGSHASGGGVVKSIEIY